MTTAEMTRELRVRLAREYGLIKEAQLAHDAGEDTDPIEEAISANASRINWLQAQLSNPTATQGA